MHTPPSAEIATSQGGSKTKRKKGGNSASTPKGGSAETRGVGEENVAAPACICDTSFEEKGIDGRMVNG